MDKNQALIPHMRFKRRMTIASSILIGRRVTTAILPMISGIACLLRSPMGMSRERPMVLYSALARAQGWWGKRFPCEV